MPATKGEGLPRLLTITLVAVLAVGGLAAAAPPDTTSSPQTRTIVVTRVKVVEKRYQGLTAHAWAKRSWRMTLAYRHERRVLLSHPTVIEAINLACATYGYCSTLWRKAECESRYSPTAANPSGASGLFQFLPSTFASTPYGRLSIWSPYANALAAGWMHEHGRGGEWVCQ